MTDLMEEQLGALHFDDVVAELYDRARTAELKGELDLALDLYTRSLPRLDTVARILTRHSIFEILLKQGRYPEAVAQSLVRQPASVSVYADLAIDELRKLEDYGQDQLALELGTELMAKVTPASFGSPDELYWVVTQQCALLRARCDERKGLIDQALALVEAECNHNRARGEYNNTGPVELYRAKLLVKKGRLEDAREAMRVALCTTTFEYGANEPIALELAGYVVEALAARSKAAGDSN